MRTIKSVSGLGDLIWLFMKLVNQSEKFNWKVSESSPQRAKPLFDLFPQLAESFEYIPDCGYKKVKRNSYSGSWATAPRGEFYLEANSHLEMGRRIETFLPDLETSFILNYSIQIGGPAFDAQQILRRYYHETGDYLLSHTPGNLIGIYTTSYSNSRYMSGWLIDEWLEFLQLILKLDKGYKFVFIGAEYDLGLSQELMNVLKPEDYINAIGQSLPVTIEILKRLHAFVGFQSGLSIINETIGANQTVMLYAQALEEMIDTWPDPKRIESGQYKGCTFGTEKHPLKPEQLIDWMVSNGKI